MAGTLEGMVNRAEDAVGGMAGRMSASMIDGADGFVEQAAISDRYEIVAAQIALERSRSEDVRAAARKMIVDHTASTHHLQAALEMNETRGVSRPPTQLDNRRERMISHLREASDDAFDKTYLDQQVLAHEEAVTLLSNYSKEGDNMQLRSVALGTLPVVERHRAAMAKLRKDL